MKQDLSQRTQEDGADHRNNIEQCSQIYLTEVAVSLLCISISDKNKTYEMHCGTLLQRVSAKSSNKT